MRFKKHLLHIFLVLFTGSFFSLAAQVNEKQLNSPYCDWKFRKKGDSLWMPATVPGTVHTDLLKNNKILQPYFSTNETTLQWIENEDWEYICDFFVSIDDIKSKNVAVLEFAGLDTYAEIWLNGEKLDSTNNMFLSWNYEVKEKLHSGNNQLAIIFSSAVKRGKAEAKKLPYTLPGDEKIFTRKAQYQYGWDWGPRFVTCGIWKPVKLLFFRTDTFIFVGGLSAYTIEGRDIRGQFIAHFDSNPGDTFKVILHHAVTGDIYGSMTAATVYNQTTLDLDFSIKNARLWWCNGQGEPYQYPLQLDLYINGKLVGSEKIRVGFRTIELVQEKDEAGSSFYFKLNGKPVFMKGANYIPPDNFLPRVAKEDYEKLVADAAHANMNMLRVWGGGVYADDAFYNACDSLGIMVWQDFMFACAMYPGDSAFVANAIAEADEQIKRLEVHPCMALWCGNNEIDEGWKNWGWQKQYNYSPADSTTISNNYIELFEKRLAARVALYSTLPYWPSSPSIGWGRAESLKQGDAHYWGVWWGMQPFEMYREKTGRFMSEYGFQGMPPMSTIHRFVPYGEKPSLESPAVKHHQKHPTGFQTIQTYMDRDYRKPKDFESYVYVSQLLQARGMRMAIDAHLQQAPYCMGTLYWQFNDCWPVTSWSGRDSYGTPKALQYYVKRMYHPQAVSMHHANDTLDVYAHCTGSDSAMRHMILKMYDLKGNLLYTKELIAEESAITQRIFRLPLKPFIEQYGAANLLFHVSCTNPKNIPVCTYELVPPKDLKLKRPELSLKTFTQPNGTTLLAVTCTKAVAKEVYLFAEYVGLEFSDNFFDMIPGETRYIKITGYTQQHKPEEIIKIRSLADSY